MATTKRTAEAGSKNGTSRARRTTAAKSASAKKGATKNGTQSPKARTTRSRAKATGTASANGVSRSRSKASSRATPQSRNGSARSTKARSGGTSSSSNGSSRTAAGMQDGMVGKLKQTGAVVRQAADRAGGPTITVAAAVAGIAGGLALRGRHGATQESMASRSMAMLHDVDAAALLGGLGKATVQLSQRSKTVARDIERVAEQAERLGKILS